MIDHNGHIITATVDICDQYDPNKEKSTGVVSAKSGMIYQCNNFTPTNPKSDPFYNGPCWYCSHLPKQGGKP